jgi:hypothetical protein
MANVRKPRVSRGRVTRAKHVDRVLKLRRLAHGSKNPNERDTALNLASVLMRRYQIQEAELEKEEKKAAAAGTEEITLLLEREDARELWQVATAQNVASVHGVVIYERTEPFPFLYIIGTAPTRALCLADLQVIVKTMRQHAVPYSAGRYGHISFLEGMAYGFGTELARIRDESLKRKGVMVMRGPDAPAAAANTEKLAQAPRPAPPTSSVPQSLPGQGYARPDPHVRPDPAYFQQGVAAGTRLAIAYYRFRFDQEIVGRVTSVPLQLKT